MEKALEHLDANIKEYRNMNPLNGERLNVLLQQITGILYYISGERSNYHEYWQTRLNELITVIC